MGPLNAVLLVTAVALGAAAGFILAVQVVAAVQRAGLKGLAAKALQRLRKARERALLLQEQARQHPRVRKALLCHRNAKRNREIQQNLPDSVKLLCIALDSGATVYKALEYAAANSTGAVAEELDRVVWDMGAGCSFAEALESLRKRTASPVFSYLAAAMEIQHSAGGSMANVLKSVSESLRQSAELEKSLQVKTSQSRLSARVIGVMPLALLLVLNLISPGYLGVFFASGAGAAAFATALLLEAAGLFAVRRCLALDLRG